MVRAQSFPNSYTLRPACQDDLPLAQNLLANGDYVHNQLDWWPLDQWIGSPACIVAVQGRQVVGLSLGVWDESPVAWWRALALKAEAYNDAMLGALLDSIRPGLEQLGAKTLTCMALADWLEDKLPALGFHLLTHIITLRKDDCHIPLLDKRRVIIRPATWDDVAAALAVDQAAFDSTWRYGACGMMLMWRAMSHTVVAVHNQKIVGYACGNRHGNVGHVVRLAIEPAQQGRAVGGQLLAAMLSAFRADGLQAVTLNTQTNNAASQKLYRRFGFRPMGTPVSVWQRAV